MSSASETLGNKSSEIKLLTSMFDIRLIIMRESQRE